MVDVQRCESTIDCQRAAEAMWDVVVIGGGPAGSLMGRQLARRSLSVLIVDKAEFPRRKVCGCCLSAAGLDVLRRAGLDHVPQQCGATGIDALSIHTSSTSCRLAVPPGAVISREALDTGLLHEAIASGAELLTGTTACLTSCKHGLHELCLKQGDGSYRLRARTVVAADGLRSGVLRGRSPFSSIASPSSRVGGGTVLRDAPPSYCSGNIYMAVGDGGYVGLVQMPDGSLDVAAAMDPAFLKGRGSMGSAAATVLHEAQMPPIEGIEDATWQGTPRLTHRLQPVAHGKIFAIGDAAAYVEPFTGEGMAWALASAWSAAELVAGAATGRSVDSELRWRKRHRQLLGGRMRVCSLVAGVVRRPRLAGRLVAAASVAPQLAGVVARSVGRPLPA